jgi:hypothetical protein
MSPSGAHRTAAELLRGWLLEEPPRKSPRTEEPFDSRAVGVEIFDDID